MQWPILLLLFSFESWSIRDWRKSMPSFLDSPWRNKHLRKTILPEFQYISNITKKNHPLEMCLSPVIFQEPDHTLDLRKSHGIDEMLLTWIKDFPSSIFGADILRLLLPFLRKIIKKCQTFFSSWSDSRFSSQWYFGWHFPEICES